MLRINTENQWQDGEDQLPQKGLTRWNEAVLCMLGISLCGFLVGLCFRTGGPVTYEIVLLVIMGLLLIPLLTRQVCISHYLCCFVTIQMISISYSEEVC